MAAGVTVLMLVLPFIHKAEAREIYKDMITDKRRQLFQQVQKKPDNLNDKKLSTRQSFAALFKLEKLAGNQNLRSFMQQAGYKSPTAPLSYLLWRMCLPLGLAVLVALYIKILPTAPSSFVQMLIILGAGSIGFFLPYILVKNKAQKRMTEIQLTFPDALDMMLICVQGGIGIEGAINRIAEAIAEHSPILAEEMGLLSAELALLNDRKKAYRDFADRAGSAAARAFANAMIQAEQYGASVASALRMMAEESREMRMAAAEQKAASLPPKLTVPMILFFLPVLFVIILGPAVILAKKTF
jgi:tight adherence protein C